MLKSFVSDKAVSYALCIYFSFVGFSNLTFYKYLQVILSSGACESGHIRNVYDVANLKVGAKYAQAHLTLTICVSTKLLRAEQSYSFIYFMCRPF